MRLIDADAFEAIITKIPDGMDADSYIAGMDFVLNKIDNAPTIEPEVKFIRLSNENSVDMFPLLTEEEKQQSREYAQGYSDALAERKKVAWIEDVPTTEIGILSDGTLVIEVPDLDKANRVIVSSGMGCKVFYLE